jgi:transposase
MNAFGSERKISAWAGVCPGNAMSAGQSTGSSTPKGNVHLKTTLSLCAIATSHSSTSPFKDKFDRLAVRNRAKAATAVSHAILVQVFRVLQSHTSYRPPQRFLSDHRKARLVRHHIRRLGKLGVAVTAIG